VPVRPRWGNGNGSLSGVTAPSLAQIAQKCRVITSAQVKKMIEEAVAKDRLEWTLRLGEEAKSKIVAARSELQQAIHEIEQLKLHAAGLESEAEFLRAEKERLERELEEARASKDSSPGKPLSALSEKMLSDSFISRLERVESLLAAHLIQDHRQPPPNGNGHGRRKPLRGG